MGYNKSDKLEFFPTEQNIVDKMWSYFPKELVGKEITVLDPCCGALALEHPTRLPDNTKINWILWDLNPRFPGVELHNAVVDEWPKVDLVIMNCPFGLKKEFHKRALNAAPYVITICPRSAFKDNWDYVLESGMEPNFDIDNMTSFKGITTPLMLGLMKRTPQFYVPMTRKERESAFNQYIDTLLAECHIPEWRHAFELQTEHPDWSVEQVFAELGWIPE